MNAKHMENRHSPVSTIGTSDRQQRACGSSIAVPTAALAPALVLAPSASAPRPLHGARGEKVDASSRVGDWGGS
jgi:hypothetical protein